MLKYLIPLCNDCHSKVEYPMFKVDFKDSSSNVHVEYCPSCKKYKVDNEIFQIDKEKDAIKKQLDHFNKLEKIVNYTTIIPRKT